MEEKPAISEGRRPTATALKLQIELLRKDIPKLEAALTTHQNNFRAVWGSDQARTVMVDLVQVTTDLFKAQQRAARLESELAILRAERALRPWWVRMMMG